MSFACLVSKAANTHSEYVIHIAFLERQWLRHHPSMLRYTYIVCLVSYVCSVRCGMEGVLHVFQDNVFMNILGFLSRK